MLDIKERDIEKIPIFRFQVEIFQRDSKPILPLRPHSVLQILLLQRKEIVSASNVSKTFYRAVRMGGLKIRSNINTVCTSHPNHKGKHKSANSPTRRVQSVLVHTSRTFLRCRNRASFHSRLFVALLNYIVNTRMFIINVYYTRSCLFRRAKSLT